MPIRITASELRRLNQILNQSIQDAQDVGARAINAFHGLDWNGQSRSGASDRVSYASSALRQQAEEALRLASYLETVAAQFEQLDRGEAAAMGRVVAPAGTMAGTVSANTGLFRSPVSSEIGETRVPDMQFAAAPAVAGGVAGLLGLGALTGAFGGLKDWWHGLQDRFPFLGKTSDDGQAAVPADPANREPERAGESEQSGFGKIMAEEERREAEEAAQAEEAARKKRAQEEAEQKRAEEEAAKRAQEEAQRKVSEQASGKRGVPMYKQPPKSMECGPTSASMVLNYYHGLDEQNAAHSADEIMKRLGGNFTAGQGVRVDHLADGLDALDGYHAEWHNHVSKAQFADFVKDGPIMAQVRQGMATTGIAHIVTVTGISDNGDTVYFNDPLRDAPTECSWADFVKSFGSTSFESFEDGKRITKDFADGEACIVVVRPE